MDPAARHQQLKVLFIAARAVALPDRNAWLDAQCAGDAPLRAALEAYLAADQRPSVLDKAVGPVGCFEATGERSHMTGAAAHPDHIGKFSILRLIDEGGMGKVFLGFDPALRREVAIKVIRPGMTSQRIQAWFERERATLASMNHPSIATAFDAGTTDSGDFYLAMEYIAGKRITTYCQEHAMPTQARLELFVQVCEAVHHAHVNGVVHRDLKPSNILIADGKDGRPIPKVIDFGIATVRGTAGGSWAGGMPGDTAPMIGTPEYMSPEQAGAGDGTVDARSDVYSLGALLYELLTDQRPFDRAMLVRGGPEAMRRVIREAEPPPPSARVLAPNARGDDDAQTSRARSRELRRELEWIPQMAMRKGREHRYQTAREMAEDIRAYLRRDALRAGPETLSYRLRKLARKHKLAVTVIGVVAATMLVATTVSLSYARRSNEQRERVEALLGFVAKVLQANDPARGGKQDTTLVEAMHDAIAAGAFKGDSETEARLLGGLAEVMLSNGRVKEAADLFERSLQINQGLFSGDHVRTAVSMNDLASAWYMLGRVDEACDLFERSVAMHGRLSKAGNADLAASMNNLATVRQSQRRFADAESLFERVLDMNKHLHPGDHAEVATSMNNLANVREAQDRFADAEPLYESALRMSQRLSAGDDPAVARGLSNLALCRDSLDRTEEAEPLAEQALQMYQRVFHGDHPSVATTLNNVAHMLGKLGRASDAEPLYRQALDMNIRLFGNDHAEVAVCLGNVARVRQERGQPEEAEKMHRRALEIFKGVHDADHPDTANTLSGLASAHEAMGHIVEAEDYYDQSLTMYRRLHEEDHADVMNGLCDLARMRATLHRQTEAREGFDYALAMGRRLYPKGSRHLARLLWCSGSARYNAGDPRTAIPELEEALRMARSCGVKESAGLTQYRDTLDKCRADLDK